MVSDSRGVAVQRSLLPAIALAGVPSSPAVGSTSRSEHRSCKKKRIEPHREVERPFRRREPVRLLVGARASVLEIQVEGAVRVVFEWHPVC
jgi:hypothetical protein